MSRSGRTLPWDWYEGEIPETVIMHETAYIETSFSFFFYRSQVAGGVTYGRGSSTYLGTMFDVGPAGRVSLGEYALVHGARIICDSEIFIGDCALISWNVTLMDTYRLPTDPSERQTALRNISADEFRILPSLTPARPIRIERNVWIGFDSCVLPGVTIGEGSIVGARSVVTSDVPAFTVLGGNPARIIRPLTREEIEKAVSNAS